MSSTYGNYLILEGNLIDLPAALEGNGSPAEFVVFGHYSTGIAGDLVKADIAQGIVIGYGMNSLEQ